MKIVKNIIRLCAAALAVLPIFGCSEEEYVKPSALLSESSLTFEAIGAEPQSLTIASDEAWFIDVDADWITVDPTSGTNTVDVTVSVTDNVANGAVAAPREGTLTIANNRGYSIRTVIYQKGDTYLGVAESTVTEAAAFEDGTVAKIRDAQVMAVAKTGFVIGDGQTNMYVEGERSVTAGDIVQLSGKCAVKGGVPAFVVDGLEVGQNAELRPAEPVVVDGTSTSYPFDKVTYAKVSGTIIGNLLRLSGGVNCKIIDPVESVGATELNVHKVEALCYYVGTFDKQYAFVIFSLKDNGVDDTVGKPLPYSDDFSWLAPYIELANSKLPEASKISDCVGAVTSSADGCANIYTTLKDNGCDVLGELRSRGYTDLNPGFKTIYLQDAYFKFGKTNSQSGLTLPLFKIDGEQDIVVSFRWCSQMQGSGKIDDTHMVVAIDGPGTVVTAKGTDGAKISDPLAHSQKQGQMMWQDAMFTIKGATTATAITIRSNEFGSSDDVVKGVFRYYLDDIEVMLAADAVTADIKVEGIENDLITFEGTPAAPVKFNVTSSAAFKVSSSANWLHVENGEGGAGQTNEVTVTCDQSELSVLRKAEITVKSGVSTKKIQVVQSAAGQTLKPFISIAGGNYFNIDATDLSFKVKVQHNVDYTIQIPDEVKWVSVEPIETKGLVEETDLILYTAANVETTPRTATIYLVNVAESLIVPIVVNQGPAAPSGESRISWTFSKDLMGTYKDAFEKNNSLPATKGKGYISWVDLEENVALDVDKKKSKVIGGTGEPYITGAWVGDYWEFAVPGVTASAGAKINFNGVTRCSGSGHKYWAMMYNVGGEWEYVKETKTETETGKNVVYTHILTKKNQTVSETVKLKSAINNQTVKIRFICVANWQCGSAAALEAPNGGTHRWSVPAGTTDGPIITITEPAPALKAKWFFDEDPSKDAYVETFGTLNGTFKNTAGDNGMYVEANGKSVGSGRITFVQVDKTSFPVASDPNPKYYVGGTGHPYVTGVWPGDAWVFTATDGNEYPAGTKLHIKYLTRCSGTGQKYWRLEYWDGEAWQPTDPLKKETESGSSAEYNFEESKKNVTVDKTFTLAKACTEMQFRMVCVVNWTLGKKALEAPNGGTCRLAAESDAEGTSPIFEVVE